MTRILQATGLGICAICIALLAMQQFTTSAQPDVLTEYDTLWEDHVGYADRDLPFYDSEEVDERNDVQVADAAGPEMRLAAFAQTTIDGQLAEQPETSSADTGNTSSKEQRTATRNLIQKRFPDLDKDELAGWVDAYVDMPLNELDVLLEQKRLLPRISPAGSGLFAEIDDLLAPSTSNQTSFFAKAQSIARNNLIHLTTPGHRREKIQTQLDNIHADGDAASTRIVSSVFDFTPGSTVPSDNPMHVAVALKDDRRAMFRLEPGCVLTRCGAFQRLADGKLGLRIGDDAFSASGNIIIPENALELRISKTGEVTHQVASGKDGEAFRKQIGRIQMAVVDDLSRLRSSNGVFFTLPEELRKEHLKMTTKVALRPKSLELSNVDLVKETTALHRFEMLAE